MSRASDGSDTLQIECEWKEFAPSILTATYLGFVVSNK